MKKETLIAVAIAIGIMIAIGVMVFGPLFAALRVSGTTSDDINAVMKSLNERQARADRAIMMEGFRAAVIRHENAHN